MIHFHNCLLGMWLLCGVVYAASPFDDLVDEVLYQAEQQMIQNSQNIIRMPDVSETVSKKILFFTVTGSIKASGTTVKDLATIYRVGDVTPSQDNATGTLSLEGTFSMKQLSAHVDSLEFKLSPIDVTKTMTVNITTNALSFKVSLTYDKDSKCTSSLDYAKVTQLGDFHVNFGGSGFISGIEDKIINFVVDKLSPVIQDAINGQIYPIINQAFQSVDICNKLLKTK